MELTPEQLEQTLRLLEELLDKLWGKIPPTRKRGYETFTSPSGRPLRRRVRRVWPVLAPRSSP